MNYCYEPSNFASCINKEIEGSQRNEANLREEVLGLLDSYDFVCKHSMKQYDSDEDKYFDGRPYQGMQTQSRSGKTCQPWKDNG